MGAASFDAINRENRLAQEEAAAREPVTVPEVVSDTVLVRVIDPAQINPELGAKEIGDVIEVSLTQAAMLVNSALAELADEPQPDPDPAQIKKKK
jgi:hypothetical protein